MSSPAVSSRMKRTAHNAILLVVLLFATQSVRANVPGGIVSGSTAAVTLTDNGSTVTIANGIVQIVCTKSGAVINQINYTYNNGSGTTTKQLLAGGKDGGELYWEFGGYGSGGTWTSAIAANPSSNGGSYAELVLTCNAAGDNQTGDLQVNFSMLRGSPGFYVTLTMKHHVGDIATGLGEMRTNIYLAPDFNWMSASPIVQRELGINASYVPAFDAPQEASLCISGVNKGVYDDKYKFSQLWGDQRVWGWGSVNDASNGVSSGANVGIWYVLASTEYYNGGPLKPELMDAPMVNMLNGGHYYMGNDSSWAADEVWTRVQGPFFVYCNNIPNTIKDPIQASQALFNDALAQGAAEATAWPYTWYNNSTYDGDYAPASSRATVTGTFTINDSGNPNASPANLWVGLVQQPSTTDSVYDFQQWYKPYQFWAKTDSTGKFTIPAVISGSNYTLYAFGPGTPGTFMSQNQTGGNPPWSYNLPATPFAVTVTTGTNNLGMIQWTPTRLGPTVFEIGYPDRTARKFRHGDDYWVGDLGPTATEPSPIWTKFWDFPNDYPNGLNYTVGVSRWATDWNFIQPVTVSPTGGNNSSSSTITFTLPTAASKSVNASLYIGIASDYYSAVEVSLDNVNLGNVSGASGSPAALPASGYIPPHTNSDGSIRESANGSFSDERITIPGSLLGSGTHTITLAQRQIGGSYFANHFMYDYIRLELPGYIPPPPAAVAAYPGNNSNLVTWPVVPGATSYNVLRSLTSGSAFLPVASGSTAVVGPVCGSGANYATYVDSTASNGNTYYYEIQSVNMTGTSAASPQSPGVLTSSTVSASIPATPSGLTATGSNAVITLAWNPSTGANYYSVRRSTLVDKIPNFSPVTVLTSTATVLSTTTLSNSVTTPTYTDTSVTNGTKYAYTVQAANAAGFSLVSGTVVGRAAHTAALASPVTLVNTPAGTSITLNWNATPGAVGYIIEMATSPNGPFTYLISVTDLTYTVSSLTPNQTYYFTITAVNAGTVSSAAVVTSTTPLAPPGGLSATAGNTQVSLKWTAVTGATGYVIKQGVATGGPYTQVGASSGPSFTVTGLTDGTPYYFVVDTVNANGAGADSVQATATPVATVPVAPLNLNAAPGFNQIVLTWSPSTSATSYTLFRSSITGGPYTTVASTTATSATDSGLKASTTYYYIVQANNSGGPSANSTEASATTLSDGLTQLTWDDQGASPAKPADGPGSWDTSTALWSDGATDHIWNNSSDLEAIFGNNNGAAGTVTLGNLVADGVVFNPPGSGAYTLTSGTLTLSGTASIMTANTNAIIASVLSSSSNATLNGNGTLTLDTPATFPAGATLNLQNLTINLSGTANSPGMLGAATINFDSATLYNVTGATGANPGNLWNPVYIAPGKIGAMDLTNRFQWGSSTVTPTLTGSGTLNLVLSSIINGSRDDIYADFSNFSGQLNLTGTVIHTGIRYFLSGTSGGAASATWSLGPDGSNVAIFPQTNGATVNIGALTGGTGGTLAGGSVGMVTYSIGATGGDTTYNGAILGNPSVFSTPGNLALTKTGAGSLTLTGSCIYTGPTVVSAGILKITGTLSSTSTLTVSSGAVFHLAGGALSVSGDINNNGIFKLSGSSTLALTGSFTNNGVYDLINSSVSLPANFTNNGVVLDSRSVVVRQASTAAGNFTVTIQSYSQHSYQLQRATSLAMPVTWSDIGAAQPGTGGTLTFTDTTGVTGSSGFYRIQVSP